MPRPRTSCAKCAATVASEEELREDQSLSPKLHADMLRVVREQNLHFHEWAQRAEHRLLQEMEKHLQVVTEMLQDLQSGLQEKVGGTVTGSEQPLDSRLVQLGRVHRDRSTLACHSSTWRATVVAGREKLKCKVGAGLGQTLDGLLSQNALTPVSQEEDDQRTSSRRSSLTPGDQCYGMFVQSSPDVSACLVVEGVDKKNSFNSHRSQRCADPNQITSFDSNRCTDLTPHIRLDDNPHLQRLQKKCVTAPFASMRQQGIGLKQEAKRWSLSQVEGRVFKTFTMVLICLNTIFIGLESDTDARMALEDPSGRLPAAFSAINRGFAVLFTMELGMRLVAYRIKFFLGHDWKWNTFDSLLVLTQFVEELLQGSSVSSIRIIRIFRLVRTLRIVRVFKTFRYLRVMVSCMFNSMSALLWAMLVLSIVMYLFAIIFVQASATHLRGRSGAGTASSASLTALSHFAGSDSMPEEELTESLLTNFRTLHRALLTMLMCISNGLDWYTVVQPLLNISPFYAFLFATYVVLVLFGVLNVLFACFVEQALQVHDRDLLIQGELARTESFLRDMQELFREADIDASNFMTCEELANYLQDERVMAYMQGHQLDVSDVTAMFELLDVDNSGAIDMQEFLIGTWRLKGSARCLDIMRIFQCLQHLEEQLVGVQERLGVQRVAAPVRSLLQTSRRSKSQASQSHCDSFAPSAP